MSSACRKTTFEVGHCIYRAMKTTRPTKVATSTGRFSRRNVSRCSPRHDFSCHDHADMRPFGSHRVMCSTLSERTSSTKLTERIRGLQNTVQDVARRLSATVLAGLLALSPLPAPAAEDAPHPGQWRIPASDDPTILALQRDMVEAWAIARLNFFDPTYGGLGQDGWDAGVKSALVSAFAAPDPDIAAYQLAELVSSLNDPYTRWQPPADYATFRTGTDGELQGGVGMMIAQDPATQRLVVLGAIEGSPADRAGVMKGDMIESVNGVSTRGWTTERIAKTLRGREGTVVNVKLTRVTNQIPGVPGRPEPRIPNQVPVVESKRVALTRGRVDISPVSAAIVADEGHSYGYIRLAQFSLNAPREMRKAVSFLEGAGVEGYIMDLRGNPGGVVDAGIDVASVWLDGPSPVMRIQGRDGAREVVLDTHRRMTDKPLVLLVNEGSASASEILAGALRDNGRATLVGGQTYGKGRMQSVFELHDGSAFLVTVAQYTTPLGVPIDRVGLRPDAMCLPDEAVPEPMDNFLGGEPVDRAPEPMKQAVRMRQRQVILQGDPCVVSGMRALRGAEVPSVETDRVIDVV